MRYRHLIEFGYIEQLEDDAGFPVVDAQGKPVTEFVAYKKAYGSANEVFGQEKYLAKQEHNTEIIKFTVQYMRGLTPDLMIRFNGILYEMVGNPDNVKYENKELKIEAKRVIM